MEPLKEMQETSQFVLTAPLPAQPHSGSSLVELPFGSKAYSDVVWRRPEHILRFLAEGCTVLYSDVDAAWKKDPFQDIGEAGKGDLYMTQDDSFAKGHFCTYFLYVQPTPRQKELMHDWAQGKSTTTAKGNQVYFNQVVSMASYDGKMPLNQVVLPLAKYPPGKFARLNTSAAASVLHANWMVGREKKIEFFQHFGLWSLSPPA